MEIHIRHVDRSLNQSYTIIDPCFSMEIGNIENEPSIPTPKYLNVIAYNSLKDVSVLR